MASPSVVQVPWHRLLCVCDRRIPLAAASAGATKATVNMWVARLFSGELKAACFPLGVH